MAVERDGSADIGPGCTVGGSSCLTCIATGALICWGAAYFRGGWVTLQVALAYAAGWLMARWNLRVLRWKYPAAGFGKLGCTLIPVTLLGIMGLISAWALHSDTWSHSQPGWGKADLVIYKYPPVDSYVVPLLILVSSFAWILTSLRLVNRENQVRIEHSDTV